MLCLLVSPNDLVLRFYAHRRCRRAAKGTAMEPYDQTGTEVLMPGGGVRGRVVNMALRAGVRVAALLLVAVVAMILVRFGPGFADDERDLDPSLSRETKTALRDQRLAEGQLTELAKKLIGGALHGDLGESNSLGMPVRDL